MKLKYKSEKGILYVTDLLINNPFNEIVDYWLTDDENKARDFTEKTCDLFIKEVGNNAEAY